MPQGTQGIHCRVCHPQVMGHQPPPFCFCLHPINHLFLVICMATLLHLATQGSFLVSLPHNLGLLGHSGFPCHPTTDLASETCLPVLLGSFSSHEPSLPISKPGSTHSTILHRVGRLGHGKILGVLVDVRTARGLKECLVHSGSPCFTPTSQMGKLRSERGKGLPMVILQGRVRAQSRFWASPPQRPSPILLCCTLSTENSFSENLQYIRRE